MKLNPHVKRWWLEALRSGKFPKTDCALRDDNGYCANGLLCRLHAEHSDEGDVWNWSADGFYAYLGASWTPPPAVVEWAGVDVETIAHIEDLNDTGSSFAAIADFIDANL